MRSTTGKARFVTELNPSPLRDRLAAICAMKAPLSAKLAAYADALRERGSPFADEYDRIVARLRSGKAGADAPKAGEEMPPFLLPDASGRMVSLKEISRLGSRCPKLQSRPLVPFLQDRAHEPR
jgi:hypothetical protein